MTRGPRVAIVLAAAAALGTSAAPAGARRADPDPVAIEVRARIDAGRYAEAESLARNAVDVQMRRFGAASLPAADALDLLVEAEGLNGRTHPDTICALAERALAIKRRTSKPGTEAWAASLLGLGRALERSGHADAGRPLLLEALRIREARLPDTDARVIQAGIELARALTEIGVSDSSKALLTEAQARAERGFGPAHPMVARVLSGFCFLASYTGDYATGLEAARRAYDINLRALGPDHPATARRASDIGTFLQNLGRCQEAGAQFEQATATMERTLGPNHPDVAIGYINQAFIQSMLGDNERAMALSAHALRIQSAALGPADPEVGYTRYRMGMIEADLDHYDRALDHMEAALRIFEGLYGPDDLRLTEVLSAIGLLDATRENAAPAETLLRRSVAISEKAASDSFAIASSLAELSGFLQGQGRVDEARPLMERSAGIIERQLGPHSRFAGQAFSSLGSLDRDARDWPRAEAALRRAIANDEENLGGSHPGLGSDLLQLAAVLRAQGRATEACDAARRALAIAGRVRPSGHSDIAAGLREMARCHWALGHADSTLDFDLRAAEATRDPVRLSIRSLSEAQALRFAASHPADVDLSLSLASAGQARGDVGRILDQVIRSRALVLDEMAARHRVAGPDSLAGLADSVRAARVRLSNLSTREVPRDSSTEAIQRQLLLDASAEAHRLEESLARRTAGDPGPRLQERMGLETAATRLPPRSALVSYVRFARRNPGTDPEAGTPWYGAFVLAAGSKDPAFIPLGAAGAIDSLVREWRERAGSLPDGRRDQAAAERTCRTSGLALRARIWDPLCARVEGRERVFIVPDGSLLTLNFAALPSGTAQYLVESGPALHLLSSERDLCVDPPSASAGGLLAVGGPDYDHTPESRSGGDAATDPAGPIAYRGPLSACPGISELRFRSLPGTLSEADEIARIWTAAGDVSTHPVLELTRTAAGESGFKRAAPGHAVIHLATHGFVVDESCASTADDHAGAASRWAALRDNPLLLSGLAFAGANARATLPAGAEDGILTAEEIATLDLASARWVVLSACNSGLGSLRAGEGLFGMRRAFAVAGAHTLIMSLWEVEDQMARRWMRELYTARWVHHLDTVDAVRAASRAILAQRRARGLSTHPATWAGFVAVGDWR